MSEHSSGDYLTSPEFDRQQVVFNIWQGPHILPKDFEGIEDEIRRGGHDIYIPEVSDRTDEIERIYRRLAKGDYQAYSKYLAKLPVGDSLRFQLAAMYNTNINLFFADYTEKQLARDEDYKIMDSKHSLSEFPSIEELLDYTRSVGEASARYYQRRDRNMAENINSGLPQYVRGHPKLRKKAEIRILMSIGDHHILLPGILEEQGYRVNLIREAEVYMPVEEVHLRIQQGQEVDRPLLLAAVASSILLPALSHEHSDKLRQVIREIAINLPEAAVEDLFEGHKSGSYPWTQQFVRAWMDRLGIKDPDLKFELHPELTS